METTWTLAQLAGYLSTWSAVGRYRAVVGADPLPAYLRRLEEIWPGTDVRAVRWPLVLRVACRPL